MPIKVVQTTRTVTGYHQLAAGDMTSVTSVPGSGSVVMIQAEAQNVRYRPDGIDPTSTVGILLAAGETHTINIGAGNIASIRVIEAASGAILNVVAFK